MKQLGRSRATRRRPYGASISTVVGILALGLAVASPVLPVVAQQTIASDEHALSRAAKNARDLLNTPVTVTFDDVSLKRAVTLIASAAHLRIQYQGTLLDAVTRPRSLHAERLPVGEAFGQMLAGTGMQAVAVAPDIIIIQPGTPATTEGIVVGIVTDAKTKQPLAGVTVMLDGATRGVVTDQHGYFRLSGVADGTHQVVLRRLGYRKQIVQVTLTDGSSPSLTVALEPNLTVRLTDVVTTGAGEQRRLEVGNSITTLNVDSIVKNTPIRNVSDLLEGRVSGADVQRTSGTVGAGSRLRIRGQASLLANEDPIVIVDGVRYNAIYSSAVSGPNSTVASLSGAALNGNSGSYFAVPATSRLDDIDPASIESIDVLKGPAASALYGSDAANGVIVVKTKRGHAGPTRWTLTGDLGRSTFNATYADSYYGWGTDPFGFPLDYSCSLSMQTAGQCTQDSISHFNPLNHRDTSPFTAGYSQRLNGQVSGGSDKVQYFVSSSYDNENGDLKFPSALRARTIDELHGAPLPGFADNPNVLNSVSIASNLTTQLSHGDLALSTNGLRQYHRDVPQGANGFLSMALYAPGYRDSVTNGWGRGDATTDFLTRNDESLSHGWGALAGNWRPASQLVMHATGGIDFSYNDQQSLLMQNYITPDENNESGASRNQVTTFVKTVDGNGTWTYPVNTHIQLVSTLGGQYRASSTSTIFGGGSQIPVGSTTYNGASSFQTFEYAGDDATAGWYFQEVVSLNQRLFVTGAVRADASSAFGSTATPVAYPKFNASWLVSQEPFFPALPGVSSLRLRAGFGHAGTQPPFSARFATYSALYGVANGSVDNILGVRTIGNPDLLPEKSVESEGGFDLGFGDDRVTIGLTLSHKTTQNALVNRTLPPSFGAVITQSDLGSPLQIMQNIGKIFNSSFEMDATAHPIDLPALNWTTSLSLTSQTNRLVTLNTDVAPILGRSSLDAETRYVPGYPIDGLWARQLVGYDDANHDGVIDASEIRLSDSAVYVGRGQPSKILGWQNSVAFWSGRVTVGANFTYENDATQENDLLRGQCQGSTCIGAVDATSSVTEQLLAAAAATSAWPYLERVSVFRFNELSVALTAPSSLARAVRAQNATISLLGRNLKLWSHYRGVDPDVNANPVGDQVVDGGSLPQPRQWSLRISLGF
jgi:TonB-linked SusC/RagA family outer membrane protein